MLAPFAAISALVVASRVEIRGRASISHCKGRGMSARFAPGICRSARAMPFQLPELPFSKDALAPHMSAETLDFHHGKHHKAYVAKTNELIEADQELGSS